MELPAVMAASGGKSHKGGQYVQTLIRTKCQARAIGKVSALKTSNNLAKIQRSSPCVCKQNLLPTYIEKAMTNGILINSSVGFVVYFCQPDMIPKQVH